MTKDTRTPSVSPPMTLEPDKYGLFLLPFHQVDLVTLTIGQAAGLNTFLCLNEKIAIGILYKYIAEWWHESGNEEDLPEDEDEAIEMYFDDHPEHESYEIKAHVGVHHMVADKILS